MRKFLVTLVPLLAVLPVLFVKSKVKGDQSGEDWIPIIAKQKEIVYQEILGQGKVVIRDSTGSYLRDRHGSVYERTIAVPYKTPGNADSATLNVVREGKVYVIDYGSRTARILLEGQAPLLQPRTEGESRRFYSAWRPLGTKMFGTIQCEGYAAKPVAGEEASRGEVWVAPSLNFLMVQNHVLDRTQRIEIVKTLEDIKTAEDPDESLFQIPEGFKILESLRGPPPTN